jgi:hypothetical protein
LNLPAAIAVSQIPPIKNSPPPKNKRKSYSLLCKINAISFFQYSKQSAFRQAILKGTLAYTKKDKPPETLEKSY